MPEPALAKVGLIIAVISLAYGLLDQAAVDLTKLPFGLGDAVPNGSSKLFALNDKYYVKYQDAGMAIGGVLMFTGSDMAKLFGAVFVVLAILGVLYGWDGK